MRITNITQEQYFQFAFDYKYLIYFGGTAARGQWGDGLNSFCPLTASVTGQSELTVVHSDVSCKVKR